MRRSSVRGPFWWALGFIVFLALPEVIWAFTPGVQRGSFYGTLFFNLDTNGHYIWDSTDAWVDIGAGDGLRIADADPATAYVNISHDGTNGVLTTSVGEIDVQTALQSTTGDPACTGPDLGLCVNDNLQVQGGTIDLSGISAIRRSGAFLQFNGPGMFTQSGNGYYASSTASLLVNNASGWSIQDRGVPAYFQTNFRMVTTKLQNLAGATVTAVGLIPDGAFLLGVSTRITLALGATLGTTSYQVGDGVDPNRWGDSGGIAQGITTDNSSATADFTGAYLAAGDVVLTAVGGNFDGTGDVRIVAHYINITAPTVNN